MKYRNKKENKEGDNTANMLFLLQQKGQQTQESGKTDQGLLMLGIENQGASNP